MWTIRKWIDPKSWMEEDADKRAAREIHVEPNDGGDGPAVDTIERPAEKWACRICSYESGAGDYCPKCVADTMQRQR